MKRIIARDTLLAYPDFTKKFTIYTDASDYQLGAVTMQEGKPLAFYSRKLSAAQMNYTKSEKEMLRIVETLREFRNILLGYEIEVFTDHHANLTFEETTESSSQPLQRWRCLVQEFNVELKYVKGADNVVADAISRLPKEDHAVGAASLVAFLEDAASKLLGVNDLFVTDTCDAFSTSDEDIVYPLAPNEHL